MNKALIKKLIDLVKLNFFDIPVSFPNEEELDIILPIAKEHHIFNLVYYGLNKCQNCDSASLKKAVAAVCKNISIDETQRMAVSEIEAAFSQNGIDFMPLKGSVMKGYYPKPDMRTMTDYDVLIKVDQYEKTAAIMQSLGYTLKHESNHEFVWQLDGRLYAELHKMLIPSYNKDYYSFFGNGWGKAHPDEEVPNKFKLSDEDFHIYNFVHLAKHYRDGGVGVKHCLDLWVFLAKNPQMDKAYILRRITEMGLSEFYQNIMKLNAAWFEDGERDDITELLEERIMRSGAYGTHNAHLISSAVKKTKGGSTFKARCKHILYMLFPKTEALINKFSVLKKAPYLLPFIWLYRVFAILFKPERRRAQISNLKAINKEDINDYRNKLEAVGLSFNGGK